MIRRVVASIAVVAALSGAACSKGGDKDESTSTTRLGSFGPTTTGVTIPIEQQQAKASKIVDDLIAHKWQAVVDTFSPAMKVNFGVESLKLAWGQVEATYGAYKSRGTTTRTHQADPQYTIFDTPMTFGTTSEKCRISFENSGEVGNLQILAASVA